ncbi:MAG: UDP-N-acetylmuramoyl-L-alanyl-D-glutamate--2,6-diaminopimelate ligase [Cytophagales bacterium]|nr:UDP-N-acetylmuramoyl-L-alanyl-D-glutamate--2,6-diaminopimelate ligase [Armatimonadota bacterium]
MQDGTTKRAVPLSHLAEAVTGAALVGKGDATLVTGVEYDSRQVGPGSLFVAVSGEKFDGHAFVTQAVAAGAAAVVVQEGLFGGPGPFPVPLMTVPDTRRALAPLACRFWDDPTSRLYLAGVTGTNGKTTTTLMIDSIARAAGDTTGTIGTLGATVADHALPGDRTTPEAPDLQRLFAQMLGAGATSAAIEVASHALALGRTEGCLFDVGVFTNLTQDHLDFHGTMEIYRDAKGLLFTHHAEAARAAGKDFTAVLNADDRAAAFYAARTPASRTLTYGVESPAADIRPEGVTLAVDHIRFTARTPGGSVPVRLGFGGTFNVANALAAIGYGTARGLSPEIIAAGLADCPPVPGRFQPVRAGQDFAVLVDYAHTPDGLENVLRSARPLTTGRLIVVFGCGGNRDRTKRPQMGRLARDLADIAIVTSDNPRREEPEAIIDEILTGMDGASGAAVYRESDRRAAIALAVAAARPGDTVVVAGKGHENYQILGDQTIHFDDVEVASEEIRR